MKKNKNLMILFLLLILLVGGLFLIKKGHTKINELTLDRVINVVDKHDYSILYIGEPTEEVKETLKSIKKLGRIELFSINASIIEVNSIIKNEEVKVKNAGDYLLFVGNEPVAVMEKDLNLERYEELVNKHFYNKIPESERAYKVIPKAKDYIKKVNSKKYTIAVFGYEGCSYCNLYLPVINKIAAERELDIYYFDRDSYDEEEWLDIMELDLEIPGECTLNGESTTMVAGFPKPMTLITKSGKLAGCIRGYVTEDVVIDKLEELKILEDKK